MSKYFQIGLVLVYLLLTVFAFLVVLELCGVHIRDTIGLAVMAGWTLFCFSAAYFTTGIFLFRYFHTRKPIYAEEEKLQRCLGEILQRAGDTRRYRLLIEEQSGLSAFAMGHNTIAVSRGMMEQMNEATLKGILAHELGHLRSKDCVVGAAFFMAGQLPRMVKWTYTLAKRKIWRPLRSFLFGLSGISVLLSLALALYLGYLLYRHHLILPILAVILFIELFSRIDRFFRFFWRLLSRFTEYRQDAYAGKLGYATELREALFQLTLEGPQPVNLYAILMKSDHPMIYNRIRRLERLEGLR